MRRCKRCRVALAAGEGPECSACVEAAPYRWLGRPLGALPELEAPLSPLEIPAGPEDLVGDGEWIWSRPRGVCGLDGCGRLQGIGGGKRPMEYCCEAHKIAAKIKRQVVAAALRRAAL